MIRRKLVLVAVAAVTAVVAAGPCLAAEPAPAPAKAPHLVLVLSGGGARGAAHIGVLKVLEELHVVPDMVVGTSMGSIVGGLYAAGWTPDEIEELLRSVDWNSVFSDGVERVEKSFRRRQDDRPQLIPSKLRFKGAKPYMPPGVLGGQSLELLLRSLGIESTGETDFDRLPIPYRAVAMDITNGEPVVIGSGLLATAMRASMSIPGAFPPVELDGRKLVDGGAAANLPIGIAQGLGATHVIAVDISSPLKGDAARYSDFLAVFSQLNSLLTVSNRVADVARLREGDVLIVPPLGDISFVDFTRATEAVGIGEQAARAKLDELRGFSGGDAAWAAFRARQHRRPVEETVIDRVRIENSSPVADEVVSAALEIAPGQVADDAVVRPALLRLYNLDYFGVIRHRLDTQPDGSSELVVTTPPPVYGRNRLQLGLMFAGDFRGDSTYALLLRHQLVAANRRGGEWQNVLQLGDVGLFESSFYQPVDYGMRYFVHPRAGIYRENQQLWVDGEPIAEYRMRRGEARVDVGRVMGSWGEVRVGAFYSSNEGNTLVGTAAMPDVSEHRAAAEARFRVDSVSSRTFPRHGAEVDLRYTRSVSGLGSDDEFEQIHGRGLAAFSFGENTIPPAVEYGENRRDVTSVFSLFRLGGPAHLSGLYNNELLGARVAYGQLAYYRRLKRLDMAGLHIRVYAGASLEAGNVYSREDPLTTSSLLQGWSAYLGADTPIGPMYIAYGVTGGRSRFYVTIGDRY